MSDEPSSGAGSRFNPFTRRTTHTQQSILLYKITTTITYILLLVTAIYYSFRDPHDGRKPWETIWGQNYATPFAQNPEITSLYWIVIFVLQPFYLISFYRSSESSAELAASANLAPHYIASNLLLFGFIHLWVRSYIWIAEFLVVINFFNLSLAYFRNPKNSLLIHAPILSLPLAWNFLALYWTGARAIGSNELPARIVGNVFIWGILVYGLFYLFAFKDWSIGFALSVLAFSTAIGIVKYKFLLLQWIFAFAIGGILAVVSSAVAAGKSPVARGEIVDEERERAPLLAED